MADDHATEPQHATDNALQHGGEPWWPEVEGGHPITELMAPTQGSPSPFGDTEFPLPADRLGYEHPVTEINR